jgi:hypothetical protein
MDIAARTLISGYANGAPPACVLKVTSAVLAKMPQFRTLRFLVLEGDLASRTHTLRLRRTGPAGHFDVAHGSVSAEMSGNREIIDDANGGRVFHFLR